MLAGSTPGVLGVPITAVEAVIPPLRSPRSPTRPKNLPAEAGAARPANRTAGPHSQAEPGRARAGRLHTRISVARNVIVRLIGGENRPVLAGKMGISGPNIARFSPPDPTPYQLGVGESVAYPCYSKILAGHFAEHQRGLANALIDAGGKIGPALGTLLGGVLMARFGWRPFFIVLGLVSLLWLPAWIKWMPRGQGAAAGASGAAPGIPEILAKRSAWATFAGHFCANYFWYFLLTWLPFYLVRERHFSMNAMATIGALAYFITAGATTIAGWLSDRMIAGGATPTRVRKTCTGMGLALTTIVLAVTVVSDRTLSMVFLMLACVFYGIFASSHWAITQTLAGPLAAGKWTGLQNFVANLAGVAAPAVTGFVVEETGRFFWAFAAAAGVVLAGAATYVFGLGRVEPEKWSACAYRKSRTV